MDVIVKSVPLVLSPGLTKRTGALRLLLAPLDFILWWSLRFFLVKIERLNFLSFALVINKMSLKSTETFAKFSKTAFMIILDKNDETLLKWKTLRH